VYRRFRPDWRMIARVRRRSLRRVSRVGQFLDVVDETIQRPLAVHLRAAAQRKAIEPLVRANIAEHRLHGGKPLPIRLASCWRIDARSHARGVRRAVGVSASVQERNAVDRRRVGRAQTLRAQRSRAAVTLCAAKVCADIDVLFFDHYQQAQRLTDIASAMRRGPQLRHPVLPRRSATVVRSRSVVRASAITRHALDESRLESRRIRPRV